MAQEIKQANIFGRIGSGIGQGLAEQIPKEIERNRLASGLQAFAQEHGNLNPMQQLAMISSTPGITPQIIQSFTDLAKLNNQRMAYQNIAGRQPLAPGMTQTGAASPAMNQGMASVDMANTMDQAYQAGMPMQKQASPSVAAAQAATAYRAAQPRTPAVAADERVPQIVNEPPLNERALTRAPWNPQQRDSRINEYLNQGFLVDQARQLAADDEARDLAEPGALQKRQAELTERSAEARKEFRDQLATKLQKSGEGVFKDVTGEMLVNMERGLERDLRTNPNLSFKEAANDWSNRALNVAKAKDQLNKLANTTGWETFFKGDQTLKKLKAYEDIFKKAGNSEEYQKLLVSDFGLSPQGSSAIAFPLTKQVKPYVDKFKPDNFSARRGFGDLPDPVKIEASARKAALDIGKFIDSDDSLLSIARSLSEKDPYFNQEAFFDQMNEDKDQIRLNDRQRRELAEGVKDWLPTWGDIKYLPWSRRSTQ